MGLLANYLHALNNEYLIIRAIAYLLLNYVVPKQKIKVARRLLPVRDDARAGCRIAIADCQVVQSPKPRSSRVALLRAGQIVQLTEKRKMWRKIYFVDSSIDETRTGWVRSKYLRTI